MPLKLNIEQKGNTLIDENSSSFSLICNTNINRNIQHQISWIKDDKELFADNLFFSQFDSKEISFANSKLEFKLSKDTKSLNYSGSYRCRIQVKSPEVGESTSYLSEPKKLEFTLSGK